MSQQIKVREGLLKRLRDMSGVTSDTAQARMLGIGRSTLQRLENGDQPSANIMAAICTTYNLGLGEVFEITESESAAA